MQRSSHYIGIAGALVAFISLAAPYRLNAQGVHPVSGRQYAHVMGVGGADWLVRPEREAEENPDLAVSLLGLRAGMVVADIGAGVGYYSIKLAAKVGPAGRVFATDLQPEMLRLMRQRLERERITNVEPVLGSIFECKLPDQSIDMAIMVDVYHEFSEPRQMLASLRRALKPDGRLVLLEYRKEDPRIPIREEHKMSVAMVTQEVTADGFVLDKLEKGLPWQHIFFFKKSSVQ